MTTTAVPPSGGKTSVPQGTGIFARCSELGRTHFDTLTAKTAQLRRQRDLVYEVWMVLLLQTAVGPMAQNDVIQKPLQVALQPVLSPMQQLLS